MKSYNVHRFRNSFFSFHFRNTEVTPGDDKTENFLLHNHEKEGHHEILVFLKGDASFFVEGSIYHLEPEDVVIARPNEFHNITHHSKCEYERIILHVNPEFFRQPGCRQFEFVFTNRIPGEGNHVSHNSSDGILLKEQLINLISRINDENPSELLIQNAFISFMHVLNSRKAKSPKKFTNASIRKVILYINEHLTEDISLDSVAEHFFMSKNYLCRIFKQHVGYTVNQYITKKRISLVGHLRKNGMPLMAAATAAGFNSYSSYYRAYRKETGNKPAEITPYEL